LPINPRTICGFAQRAVRTRFQSQVGDRDQ
jgi:hypothetical protein